MHRYFVTGTDTDVGKTIVSAALAAALQRAGQTPTVVKLVQTGISKDAPGDAERAGVLAGARSLELVRFEKATDPWTAALAQGTQPVTAGELVRAISAIEGALVAEGSGGIMVPINAREDFGDVAASAALGTILVVGLRLGCLNHALLTIERCRQRGLQVTGGVLVDRWDCNDVGYAGDVERALQGKLRIFGILPFAADETAAVDAGARLFECVIKE